MGPEPARAARFGRYELLHPLAVGGMAEVSLARLDGAAGFNKLMVIKQVLPAIAEQRDFVELFLDEGRLAAQLNHPNIAQTFELGEVDGRYFLAIEYVPGQTLAAIDAKGRELARSMPLPCALRVISQACEALDYAHAVTGADGKPLNVVHRDVTPSNIMVTWHGSVRLLDFGIARANTHLHKTQAGTTRGKLGFMSPEQVRAEKVDLRSDIYALGAVLYLLATGQKPFIQKPGESAIAVFTAASRGEFPKPREIRPTLPVPLEAIILKAMALKREDRFQSAGEMLEALTRFANARSMMALPRELSEYVSGLFPGRAQVLGKLESGVVDEQVLSDAIIALSDTGSQSNPVLRATVDDRHGGDEPKTVVQTDEEDDPKTVLKQREHEPRTIVASPDAPLETVVRGGTTQDPLGGATVVDPRRVPHPSAPRTPGRARGGTPSHSSRTGLRPPSKPVMVGALAAIVAFIGSGLIARSSRESAVTPPVSSRPRAGAGFLSLDSSPHAPVRIGGKQLGTTPLHVELLAGSVEVTLTDPGTQLEKQVTVEVKAGETTTRFVQLK